MIVLGNERNRLVPLLGLFGFACPGGRNRFAFRQHASSRQAAMARRRPPLFSQAIEPRKRWPGDEAL
jgi:hypothetical protein